MNVRDLRPDDREWAADFLRRHWGETRIVSRGVAHEAAALPGFVLEAEGEPVGLLTYRPDGAECEIVSLDSERPQGGGGTLLVEAMLLRARGLGVRRLWLITSNDNLDAMRFYQRRGFRMVAVHRGAIDRARAEKPSIPERGLYGIPIADEVEFEVLL